MRTEGDAPPLPPTPEATRRAPRSHNTRARGVELPPRDYAKQHPEADGEAEQDADDEQPALVSEHVVGVRVLIGPRRRRRAAEPVEVEAVAHVLQLDGVALLRAHDRQREGAGSARRGLA